MNTIYTCIPTRTKRVFLATLTFCLMGLSTALMAQSTEISLVATEDATLYEDSQGSLANAGGNHLFVGRTAGRGGEAIRRTLLRFDLTDSIPAGATIESVSLSLTINKAGGGPAGMGNLHKVTASWEEGPTADSGNEGNGASAADGDVTWIHRERPGTAWTTAGGDFEANASATSALASSGEITWSSDGMVADVQAWLEDSDSNFGWILLGNESTGSTARRLNSKDGSSSSKPTLTITYNATSVSILDQFNDFASLRIFPNPSRSTVQVEMEGLNQEALGLEVLNMIGKRVYQATLAPIAGQLTTTLELADLAAGVYFLKVQQGDKLAIRRLVRE